MSSRSSSVSRTRFSQAVAAALLALYACSSTLINYIVPSSWLRILLGGIMLLMILSNVLVVNVRQNDKYLMLVALLMFLISVWNNYYLDSGQWLPLLIWISMFALLYLSLKKGKWIEYYLRISFFAYLFYAICTIVFSFMPSFYVNSIAPLFPSTTSRLIGWYNLGLMPGLTNHYSTNGMFLATGTILCFAWILSQRENKKTHTRQYIIFAIFIIALAMCGKRAHFAFSLGAMMVMYILYVPGKRNSRRLRILGGCVSFVVLFFVLMNTTSIFDNILERFSGGSSLLSDSNMIERYRFWNLAITQFKSNWLKGIGWAQFYVLSTRVLNYSAFAHNIYIELLCETGVIGFLLYVVWFILLFTKTIKLCKMIRNNPYLNETEPLVKFLALFSVGFQVFFFIYGLTGNPLYDKEMYIPYFVSCAITIYYTKLVSAFEEGIQNE